MHNMVGSLIALMANKTFMGNPRRSKSSSISGTSLCFEQFEDRRMLATFMVTNLGDAPANTPAAVGTLRQAIFDANQLDDHDEIVFSTDPVHGLNGGTIQLTGGTAFSRLSISKAVTIDASMLSGGITIDATGNNSGVFYVGLPSYGGREVILKNLTISGGNAGLGGGINFNGNWNVNTGNSGILTIDGKTPVADAPGSPE